MIVVAYNNNNNNNNNIYAVYTVSQKSVTFRGLSKRRIEVAIEAAVVCNALNVLITVNTLLLLLLLLLFSSENPRTCCDASQVETLNTNMKIPREVINNIVVVGVVVVLVL